MRRSLAGEQNHWSERGRAASVANADALGHPHRSVLSFSKASADMIGFLRRIWYGLGLWLLRAGETGGIDGIRFTDFRKRRYAYQETITETLEPVRQYDRRRYARAKHYLQWIVNTVGHQSHGTEC